MAKHSLHFHLFTFSEILNLQYDCQMILTCELSLFWFGPCSIKINVYMLKILSTSPISCIVPLFIFLKLFKLVNLFWMSYYINHTQHHDKTRPKSYQNVSNRTIIYEDNVRHFCVFHSWPYLVMWDKLLNWKIIK